MITNSVVQDHYGDVLFRLGRYDEAIAAWSRALSGDRDDVDQNDIDRKIRIGETEAAEEMINRSRQARAVVCLVAGLGTASCGASLMKLPAGPGAPAADAREALSQATDVCRTIKTFTAESSVSGSVGGRSLRARLNIGLQAPDSARLEAIGPFARLLFTLAASGDSATLVLHDDDRILQNGQAAAVLEALTGVPLDAADLREALTGCASSEAAAGEARQLGDDWRTLQIGSTTLYLRRDPRTRAVAAGCGRAPARRPGRVARRVSRFRRWPTATGPAREQRCRSFRSAAGPVRDRAESAASPGGLRSEDPGGGAADHARRTPPRGAAARRAVTFTARAFAKINLDLRIGGVLPGGYHELRTTFQSIALHDVLTFRRTRGPFTIRCDDPGCPTDGEHRRASRRADLACRRTSRHADRRLGIDRQAHPDGGRPRRRQRRRRRGAARAAIALARSAVRRRRTRAWPRRSVRTCRFSFRVARRSAWGAGIA